MIEFGCGFERVVAMAVGTRLRKRLLMIVGMARNTVGIQSQERISLLADFLIGNEFGIVTIFALLFVMGPG